MTVSASWIQPLAEAGPRSMDGIPPVIFDDGGVSRGIDCNKSVMAYYEAALIFGTGPNRALGAVQVPWERNTGLATYPNCDMRGRYPSISMAE